MTLVVGTLAPDFTLPIDQGGSITLSALRGKTVIVYFYPKDDTPGCTTQACGFRDILPNFNKLDTKVIGISKDNIEKHARFRQKYDLTFPLASDEEGAVCEAYGVWVEKMNYGKKYMGIERSTFLIDPEGKIKQIWRKVKVDGHVEAVLKAVQNINE